MSSQSINSVCLCSNVRQVARQMTAIYEAHLSPYGITAPQFSFLQRLHHLGPIANLEFADLMGMDRSTLSRGLKPLISAGFVETVDMPEGVVIDKRSFGLQLTPTGALKYRTAHAGWAHAQVEVQEKLGAKLSSELLTTSSAVRDALDR